MLNRHKHTKMTRQKGRIFILLLQLRTWGPKRISDSSMVMQRVWSWTQITCISVQCLNHKPFLVQFSFLFQQLSNGFGTMTSCWFKGLTLGRLQQKLLFPKCCFTFLFMNTLEVAHICGYVAARKKMDAEERGGGKNPFYISRLPSATTFLNRRG